MSSFTSTECRIIYNQNLIPDLYSGDVTRCTVSAWVSVVKHNWSIYLFPVNLLKYPSLAIIQSQCRSDIWIVLRLLIILREVVTVLAKEDAIKTVIHTIMNYVTNF